MFENLDEIVYTEEQLKKLNEWKNNNTLLVRNYNPVLNEGIIKISGNNPDDKSQYKNEFLNYYSLVHFNLYQETISIQFFILLGNVYELVLKFKFNSNEKTFVDVYDIEATILWKEMYEKKCKGYKPLIDDMLFIYCATMAYMSFYEKEYIITDEAPKKLTGSQQREIKRKQRENPKSLISLNKKVYKLCDNAKFKNPTKRDIKRVAEAWGVRGHYRNMNGNRVWIKPYTKGKGRLTSKIYQMEIN